MADSNKIILKAEDLDGYLTSEDMDIRIDKQQLYKLLSL